MRRRAEEILGRGLDQRLAQLEHAAPVGGDRFRRPGSCVRAVGSRTPPAGLARSDLLKTTMIGTSRARELARGSPSSNSPQLPGVDHENAHVGAVEHLPGLLDPLLAQRADVVDAGRVDEQHRPERQQLHRLLDRVGRRAGDLARRSRPPAASARSAATTCRRCGGRTGRCADGDLWECSWLIDGSGRSTVGRFGHPQSRALGFGRGQLVELARPVSRPRSIDQLADVLSRPGAARRASRGELLGRVVADRVDQRGQRPRWLLCDVRAAAIRVGLDARHAVPGEDVAGARPAGRARSSRLSATSGRNWLQFEVAAADGLQRSSGRGPSRRWRPGPRPRESPG